MRKQLGQSTMEYTLVLGIMFVAMITAVKMVQNHINNKIVQVMHTITSPN